MDCVAVESPGLWESTTGAPGVVTEALVEERSPEAMSALKLCHTSLPMLVAVKQILSKSYIIKSEPKGNISEIDGMENVFNFATSWLPLVTQEAESVPVRPAGSVGPLVCLPQAQRHASQWPLSLRLALFFLVQPFFDGHHCLY